MTTTPSSLDLKQLVEKYIDDHDWGRDKAHVQNTSEAVRQLVEGLVETGSIDESAMRTVYNLCQNDNALKPETKKQRIDDLDIDANTKAPIKERIDEGTGIIGKGTYSVPIEGYEEEAFSLLATAIRSDDRTEIDAAIEEFAALEIEGIQNGIISPILYFLHPTKYPISNDRSRTGMQQFFNYEMSGRLTAYLDEVERFYEVRANYPFKEDFRHLDSFFNWIEQQESPLTESTSTPHVEIPSDVEIYWVNQHNPSEIEEEYLRAKTDGLWHHNLPKLSVGDVVFHNFDNELIGISTVADTAETYTSRGEEYYRVEVDLRSFGKPVVVDDDLKERLGQDDHRLEKYYPIDKNENLNEAYLANLSRSAAEFLLSQVDSVEATKPSDKASDAPKRIWQITPARGGTYWETWEQTGIASIGFGLDHKITDDVEDIDDVDELSEEELVEIAADTGDNHGRGMAYRFQYEIDEGDVIIAKQGRRSTSEPDVIYGIGVVTTDHHEKDFSEIHHTSIVDVDWKVTFGQSGVDVTVDSDSDSIKAYTLDTLDPEYYHQLASELAVEGDTDLDELLALVFDESTGIDESEIVTASEGADYFWISANPAIWEVDSIKDGGEVFYTAYNRKGNKRRIFGAFEEAAPGDKVLFYESHPVQAIVAEGTIVEGLHEGEHEKYDNPVKGITIEYSRPIENISWEQLTAVPDIEGAAPIKNRAQGSLFPLTEDEFETILALEDPIKDGVSQDAIDQLTAKLTTPEIEITVPDSLYFDNNDRLRREIEASLRSGKHIILTGPPGTGKTKLAQAICESATTYEQVDDYRFTTATSEWTAFDTIGGYVPSTSDGGQKLLFEPRLFLKCFRRDRVVNEWLIIDEINRSDIDKAFGQLFSVLSGDSTELPYERDRTVELLSLSESTTDEELADIIGNPDAFPVTPSWRLIATMNTYDKTSLYEMSYAFMRRFNFIHVGVPPLTNDGEVRTSLLDPNGADNYATAWLDDDETLRPVLQDIYPVIAVLWQRINEHRVIGPSIVYDIIRYLESYNDTDGEHINALTSAVVSLVYPQLEGMRPEQQKRLIRSLTDTNVATENGSVNLNLDGERLRQQASDFFGITFTDDS
ncbi:AAA family ATPase [Halosolutus amylolyticus]|uniref:AAA family ATPase n=1 Tax=Halosolutus amylolyticus TaxID=2932267 RepID=A0ABD5PJP2_9EURY|nr:AAA family ATPase [Halosolutus amylolyticus]